MREKAIQLGREPGEDEPAAEGLRPRFERGPFGPLAEDDEPGRGVSVRDDPGRFDEDVETLFGRVAARGEDDV